MLFYKSFILPFICHVILGKLPDFLSLSFYNLNIGIKLPIS